MRLLATQSADVSCMVGELQDGLSQVGLAKLHFTQPKSVRRKTAAATKAAAAGSLPPGTPFSAAPVAVQIALLKRRVVTLVVEQGRLMRDVNAQGPRHSLTPKFMVSI